MKNSIFLFLNLFMGVFPTFSQTGKDEKNNKLQIIKFETSIGMVAKDSVWDLEKPIKISVIPNKVNVTLFDNDAKLDLICVISERIKLYDTLRLGNNPSVNLFNLTGGNYTLNFINLTNQNKAQIKFSITPVFWERWWFTPFALLVISVILGLIFYAIYLIRLRSQMRLQAIRHELEIKALRAQMNPHFIFNSMNTIDAYILRKRFIEASDCLQKFSKLIRQILENSEYQTISIEKELETLKLYIQLEQERFSNSFNYRFEIQPDLLTKEYQIPPLLIQPFVENAILHGIRHLTNKKGEILLEVKKESDEILNIKIIDNGIGRKASMDIKKESQSQHKSMGIDITLERINSQQALFGDIMETQIIDLEEGTLIEIKLPLILSKMPLE